MTAQDILLSLDNEHLDVWQTNDKKIAVSFQNCEIKDGMFLKTIWGEAKTFNEACENYLEQLHGETLVFNACSQHRKEVRVL